MNKKFSIGVVLLFCGALLYGRDGPGNSRSPARMTKDFKSLRVRWAENFLGSADKPFDDALKTMVKNTNRWAKQEWDKMLAIFLVICMRLKGKSKRIFI